MKRNREVETKPVSFAQNEGPSAEFAEALDTAWDHGSAELGDTKLERASLEQIEAAVTHPRPGWEVLHTCVNRPGRTPPPWRSTARFAEKTFLDTAYLECMPVRLDLGAPLLVALERAMGRSGDVFNCPDSPFEAVKVDIEGAVYSTLQSGSRHLHVRYKSKWFGAGIFRKFEPAPNPDPDPGPGQAAPKIAIA